MPRLLPLLEVLEARETPAANILAVGPDAGHAPVVKVFNVETGSLLFNINAYPQGMQGGVRVATADVTGDGVDDIITGPGTGGSRVRVFDGVNGKPVSGTLGGFQAFAPGQTSGVWVAAGDVNGDGRADIIVGANDGFAPSVKVFSGSNGSLLHSFTISDMDSTSGVRVAAGDVNGDGHADIIAAAGAGQRSLVCVVDGATGQKLRDFFAYDQGFLGGVYVAAGDLSGDGLADIITGPGAGHAPLVRVFRGTDTASLDNFLAADPAFTGGVRVAAFDANGDTYADITAAAGPGAGIVRWFDGLTKSQLGQAAPYGAGFSQGVFVAGNGVPPPQFTTLSGTNTVTFWASSSIAAEMGFAVVSVQIARENSDTVTVDYATASGTAISGVDFTSTSGTLTFTDGGPTLVAFNIPIIEDTLDEYNETFTITLSNISGGTLGSPSVHTVTINDDDEPPGPADGCLDGSCYTGLLGRPINPSARPLPTRGSPVPETSGGPVRYFDGTIRLQHTDLYSDGFGGAWGITRSWSNHQAYGLNSLGANNTAIAELPYLQNISSSIAVIFNGLEARYFDYNLITYLPRHFLTDSLDEDTGAKEFTFTDSTGNRIVFHNFDASLHVDLRGQFKTFIDPAGNEIAVTDWTNNKPEIIERSGTLDSVTTTETYVFSYVASGANEGEIASIELKRQVGAGDPITIRKVEYTYYDGSEDYGHARDLKYAAIKDAANNVIDTWYYRYYTSDEPNGMDSGLQFVFAPRSFDRLKAVYSDPATATEAQAAPYADLYLEYDASRRVSKEVVQGDGACCGGAGGLGEYTFTYANSSFANSHNNWARKTVETLPDGNQHIVYTNFAGQVMLKAFKDTTTDDEWITYFKYDTSGRLIWTVNPSALTGYDDSQPDLVTSTHLRDSEGLIEIRTYSTTTTASSSTAGSVSGQLEKIELKRGENGTAVKQEQVQYFTRSAFDKT
ncbi:MAG: FG-GAP-like repeat-containing protein, partial [Gemmataceae bacterium]|nr:FG-GAP-like repeat-containing protein [Gemmataceae bacterium]